jgi:hypothetical protein
MAGNVAIGEWCFIHVGNVHCNTCHYYVMFHLSLGSLLRVTVCWVPFENMLSVMDSKGQHVIGLICNG